MNVYDSVENDLCGRENTARYGTADVKTAEVDCSEIRVLFHVGRTMANLT